MTYHIVLFIKENSVEAVPSHWLSSDGKTCAWPKRHLDPIRQIEKKKQPNTLEYTWFQIRILLAKSISSLKEAKAKAEVATFTSDLSSIEEDKETRNIRCKKIDDDYINDGDSFSLKKKPKKHFKTIQDKILSPPKFIETGNIVNNDEDTGSDSDTMLISNIKSKKKSPLKYFQYKTSINISEDKKRSSTESYLPLRSSSISKNKPLVSTSAILISPFGKWDVDDIDIPNSNKIIKRKLDFGSTLIPSKSSQINTDIYHDNINIDNTSIHYTDGMDNINVDLKSDCLEKFNVEDKHLDNTPTHFSTPSSSVSISNSSKVQAEMLNILKSLTRSVTNIKYDVKNITTKFDRLNNVLSDLQKNQNSSSTKNNYCPVDESIYKFPLINLEELNIFEEKIVDNDFRQKIVHYLSRLSRDSVSDMTRQIMYNMFHNNLLSKFSYAGQKHKMVFATLHSCSIIFETIRSVQKHRNCTDQEVLKPMKFFMANAKFREEKKQKQ
ncbi:uncharacterized protein LOC132926162, partial [Rhopalosiphum padi]|uniref:uncharacterized protein LOC132926162 n=1 Tax=Rhopalosiphum padi TaxID=40932 RepID=UPI00298D9A17